jgi:hypothetical protein
VKDVRDDPEHRRRIVTGVRKFIIILVVLAAVVAGAVVYLVATTPSRNEAIRFPLGAPQRALLAGVPASSESFAFVPAAAGLEAKLRANPITAQAVDDFEQKQSLPPAWLLGRADLLAWKTADGNRYLVHLDPFRALLVKTYVMAGGDLGDRLLLAPPAEPPIEAGELQRILALTDHLPAADALVVQRESGRGAFPPLARPAATSVQVTPVAIVLVSRAAAPTRDSSPAGAISGGLQLAQQPSLQGRLAKSAILSATFAAPPREIGDLNRLFGTKVSTLLENGGSVALYDIDERKLIPRPLGVIAVPDDPPRRAALEGIVSQARQVEALGVRPRTAEARGELVLSFDDSIALYLKDALEPPAAPAGRWALRADPPRLVPALKNLSDNLGFRIAAPRLFRSARDLSRWIGALEKASTIEAADAVDGAEEQLTVRLSAK